MGAEAGCSTHRFGCCSLLHEGQGAWDPSGTSLEIGYGPALRVSGLTGVSAGKKWLSKAGLSLIRSCCLSCFPVWFLTSCLEMAITVSQTLVGVLGPDLERRGLCRMGWRGGAWSVELWG